MTLPSIEPYVTIWFRGFALGPFAIGFARLNIGWIFHVGWLYRRHRWQRCEWGFVSLEHTERTP